MASTPMGLPTPGTTPGFSQLDGPPPSPALETGLNPGMPALGSMVPSLGSGQMPPEVLTGVLDAGDKMVEALDSFAQVLPDLSADFALVKETLMRALARVAQAGGGPVRPNSTGPGFPGGGFDQGGMPLASGG